MNWLKRHLAISYKENDLLGHRTPRVLASGVLGQMVLVKPKAINRAENILI